MAPQPKNSSVKQQPFAKTGTAYGVSLFSLGDRVRFWAAPSAKLTGSSPCSIQEAKQVANLCPAPSVTVPDTEERWNAGEVWCRDPNVASTTSFFRSFARTLEYHPVTFYRPTGLLVISNQGSSWATWKTGMKELPWKRCHSYPKWASSSMLVRAGIKSTKQPSSI